MSTFEYNDLFIKAQEIGNYHVFVFDIVDSKKMNNKERYIAQQKMINLMLKIYNSIKKIEQNQNKKILVFEEDFIFWNQGKLNGFGFKYEPFLHGDMFGFTIYRDSLSKDIVYDLFKKYKKELDIDFYFHTCDGYYETNDYGKGNELYFRGYCIDTLSKMHKTYKNLKK